MTKAPFGQRLAALMQRSGTLKKAFIAKVGISRMTLNRYERETREPPASVLVAMAAALDCSTDELLGLAPQEGGRWARRARLLDARAKLASEVLEGRRDDLLPKAEPTA